MGMLLQGADGPGLGHGTFDSCLEGARLVVTIDENHHLAGCQHSAYAYGEGVLGHLVDIIGEEAAVGDDGICSKCLDACA